MLEKIQDWYLKLSPIQKSKLNDALIWIPFIFIFCVTLILSTK